MRKFFKWLAGLFGSTSVVTIGSANTTTVTQTSTVNVLKGREPEVNYKYKLLPLSEQEIRNISRKAVDDIAVKKIVTKAIEEQKVFDRHPSQKSKPFDADKMKKAVAASNNRRSQNRHSRGDDNSFFTSIIATSSICHSSSSSDDGGSYSSGSCDSGSSSGGCD